MKSQFKKFTHEEEDFAIVATARYDDQCGNGHNTFSITGELYDRSYTRGESSFLLKTGRRKYLGSCGCIHQEIAQHFPELAPLLKWHSCSSDGPLHYVANTLYWAKEGNLQFARDCAIWPEATLDQLKDKATLLARLPALLAEFREGVESIGLVYEEAKQ